MKADFRVFIFNLYINYTTYFGHLKGDIFHLFSQFCGQKIYTQSQYLWGFSKAFMVNNISIYYGQISGQIY